MVGLLIFIVGGLFVSMAENKCTQEKRGYTRSNRFGGIIKVCDGNEWIVYRADLNK